MRKQLGLSQVVAGAGVLNLLDDVNTAFFPVASESSDNTLLHGKHRDIQKLDGIGRAFDRPGRFFNLALQFSDFGVNLLNQSGHGRPAGISADSVRVAQQSDQS